MVAMHARPYLFFFFQKYSDLTIVSRRLGHSQPSTTLNYYGHMIPEHQDTVASLMDDLMTPAHLELPIKVEKGD